MRRRWPGRRTVRARRSRCCRSYDTGAWSRYHTREADLGYHDLMTLQLRQLALKSGDPAFRAYADRFTLYRLYASGHRSHDERNRARIPVRRRQPARRRARARPSQQDLPRDARRHGCGGRDRRREPARHPPPRPAEGALERARAPPAGRARRLPAVAERNGSGGQQLAAHARRRGGHRTGHGGSRRDACCASAARTGRCACAGHRPTTPPATSASRSRSPGARRCCATCRCAGGERSPCPPPLGAFTAWITVTDESGNEVAFKRRPS